MLSTIVSTGGFLFDCWVSRFKSLNLFVLPKDKSTVPQKYKQAFLWDFAVNCYRFSQKQNSTIFFLACGLDYYGLSQNGFDLLHHCKVVPSSKTIRSLKKKLVEETRQVFLSTLPDQTAGRVWFAFKVILLVFWLDNYAKNLSHVCLRLDSSSPTFTNNQWTAFACRLTKSPSKFSIKSFLLKPNYTGLNWLAEPPMKSNFDLGLLLESVEEQFVRWLPQDCSLLERAFHQIDESHRVGFMEDFKPLQIFPFNISSNEGLQKALKALRFFARKTVNLLQLFWRYSAFLAFVWLLTLTLSFTPYTTVPVWSLTQPLPKGNWFEPYPTLTYM